MNLKIAAPSPPAPAPLVIGETISLHAVSGIPVVGPGDDVAAHLRTALAASGLRLRDGDILVVTSKLFSRAQGRFVDLSTVRPGARAHDLAHELDKDPRLVELILAESQSISRTAPRVLIVRHKLGFICANAGIDSSNARPADAAADSGPWVLLLPENPDACARKLADDLAQSAKVAVVVTDSLGRPFRLGTVGAAIGAAGLPSLYDQRGAGDLFGKPLEHTMTALADQIAAAGDLLAGQAAERRPVILMRGLDTRAAVASPASTLNRPPELDLYP